jgi:hypothetical protein
MPVIVVPLPPGTKPFAVKINNNNNNNTNNNVLWGPDGYTSRNLIAQQFFINPRKVLVVTVSSLRN